MEYRVEVLDPAGRRVRWFTEVFLLDVTHGAADEGDRIKGLLPKSVEALAPGHGIRVFVDGSWFAEGRVVSVSPVWGDARKLVVDEYVHFNEVVAFEAVGDARRGDVALWHKYANKEVSALVKHLLNRAPGRIHYGVAHAYFPNGARREFLKFAARRDTETALPVGGIDTGTWAGLGRVDASGASAKDGNTITGLKVDGADWPDLRLMMVDAEEVTLNARAIARHPEVASWTSAEYDARLYKQLGDAAQTELQARIDAWGVDFVELNAHVDGDGAYDGRVDADGRYVGIAHGSNNCLNPAMIEKGLAGVYLHEDGKFLPPEWEMKDYLSYDGVFVDTVDTSGAVLTSFETRGSVLESLAALSYAAGGFSFTIDAERQVSFLKKDAPDRVIEFDPGKHALVLGSSDARLMNTLAFSGNSLEAPVEKSYTRVESVTAFGGAAESLSHFGFSREADADLLAAGLLDDLAYPHPSGRIEFFEGDASLRVGDVLAFEGEDLRRIEPSLADEWGGVHAGVLVGRVRAVRHLISGRKVSTVAYLGSPLRSVEDPLSFMVYGQERESELYAFRLDDAAIGLDTGWHLD